ncbi:amidase family protein [Demequina sp. SO4-13]|uniref:amidase family protein n=1 Tax=Demequina sp. SO4-13 TaxID=3401027 RepID=UPI003AF6255E
MKSRRTLSAVGAGALAATLAMPAVASAAPGEAPAAFLSPYYTELDVTGDRQVSTADLEVVANSLGATADSASWDTVAAADVDEDGTITVTDLAAVSQRMIYDDGEFEIVEASVLDMQAAMNAGVTSSVAITQEYLDRISAYDTVTIDPADGGRPLNSIISTSAVALDAAAQADAVRESDGMTSMLLGVPIALKDNYNTSDMPTTGGCSCWDDNWTEDDASMVEGLRDAGAVILAKASLDEFAYGFSSVFSSFQEPGEITPIASPYNTTRTAGGSSGGSAASVAANLVGIALGTDTGGSIRVPASYNQLVGVRPTVGLSSRDGIIPLALSQDTGGPLTRSVVDAAVSMDALTGVDENDPVTSNQAGLVPESYTAYLDEDALDGARIGYASSMLPTSNATVMAGWNAAVAAMEAQGATVVEITPPEAFTAVLEEGSGSTNEFKHDLDEYVEAYLAPEVELRTLTEILETENFVTQRRGTYEYRNGVTSETYEEWAGPEGSHTLQLAAGKELLHGMFDEYELDSLVYPSTVIYGTYSRNMRLSPNTGMPAVTVPMTVETEGDRAGGGAGLEFLGRDFAEGTILGLAYAFEQATDVRTTPALYGPVED